jgi:hypothetical protein
LDVADGDVEVVVERPAEAGLDLGLDVGLSCAERPSKRLTASLRLKLLPYFACTPMSIFSVASKRMASPAASDVSGAYCGSSAPMTACVSAARRVAVAEARTQCVYVKEGAALAERESGTEPPVVVPPSFPERSPATTSCA